MKKENSLFYFNNFGFSSNSKFLNERLIEALNKNKRASTEQQSYFSSNCWTKSQEEEEEEEEDTAMK